MASSLRVFGVKCHSNVKKTRRDAPFINIDLAVAAHVEHAQRPPDRLRPDQKLQVRLAAGLQELDHFFVPLLGVHGLHDLINDERARVVLVHELEDLAGGGEELGRELGDLLARRGRGLGAPLGPRGELGPERDLDGLLPALLSTGNPRKRRRTSPPRARRRRVEGAPKVAGSETRHSIAVISPSLSVSIAAMAASRRAGTSRYCKFSLPQLMRNKTTGFDCSLTASTCVEIKFERPTPSTRDSS